MSANSTDTTDVFISYKREERGDVERIAERLRGLGLSVWFDTKLASGVSFDEEINREVRSAKCVLVCWSPGAMASDWVRAEASIGRGREVLAAVMLRPTELYPPFNLIHAEDLSTWHGEDIHAGWLNTLVRVGELTDRPDIVQRAKRYVAAGVGPAPSIARAPGAPPPEPPRKGVFDGRALALGAIALLMVAAGGWYAWQHMRGGEPQTVACNTIDATADPLTQAQTVRLWTANSLVKQDCYDRYQKALIDLENTAWQKAKGANTAEALQAFLNVFPANATPSPRFAKDAEAMLAALKSASSPETPSVGEAGGGCVGIAREAGLAMVQARMLCGSGGGEEPAKCFRQVMRGGVLWGEGGGWQAANAVRLCRGAESAASRIACFAARQAVTSSGLKAIAECADGATMAAPSAPTDTPIDPAFKVGRAVLFLEGLSTVRADCPHDLRFNGSIQTQGTGTLRYRFVRSDGGASEVFERVIDRPITNLTFERVWRMGAAGPGRFNGWMQVEVLSPENVRSDRVEFRLICN